MSRVTEEPRLRRIHRRLLSSQFYRVLFCLPVGALCLIVTLMLVACGGGSSTNGPQIPLSLSGNWQFTMASPTDGSLSGGLQGGFLSQANTTVTGNVAYSLTVPSNPQAVSSTGTATISSPSSLVGQNVMLSATAGTFTFTFTGTLSPDNSTMAGFYTCVNSSAAAGTACASGQTELQWVATLVLPLTGPIQGDFHSTGGPAGLAEQEFIVAGALSQAISAQGASATVTGDLNFLNPTSNSSDYPCIAVAQVNGQISGNTVSLQILGSSGSIVGQIGATSAATSSLGTVTFSSDSNVLQSLAGPAYAVYSSACGGGTLEEPADFGGICLALNGSTACSQPITLTPATLTYPAQTVGTTTAQNVTLTNSGQSVLSSLTLSLTNASGVEVFTEADTCGSGGSSSSGAPFNLNPAQACVITIVYTPQCGNPCSPSQSATLIINVPGDSSIFTLPISGTLESGSATERSETSVPQWTRPTSQRGHGENRLFLTPSGLEP
jgi:hypothetical protein